VTSRPRRPSSPRDEEREQRRERHDPEPADLNQSEDHDLAELRPVRRRVDDDQSRHADRGRGGEERRHKRGASRLLRREREHEQPRADQNSERESADDQLRRMPPPEPLTHEATP
jgi:hypothetical protein